MAFPGASKSFAGTDGGTITVPVSAIEHEVNDVIMIHVSGLNGTDITLAGWASIGPLSNSGSARNAIFYKRVTSAPVADVTITSSNSSFRLGADVIVIKGADVTDDPTVIDAWDEATSGSTLTITSPALTVSDPNSLILLFISGERSTEDPFFKAGDCAPLCYTVDPGAHFILGCGYTYCQSSPSPQYSAINADDGNGGIGIFAVAIKDNGNGECFGYSKQGSAADLVYVNEADHGELITAEVDVTGVGFTPQISSITNAISGVTINTINDSFSSDGVVHRLFPNAAGLSLQANGAESPYLIIRGLELTNTVDLSNKKLVFSATGDPLYESLDNLGRLVGFGDGTNVSFFLYDGNDSSVKSSLGIQTYLIDTAATGFEIATIGPGSLDWTAIKYIIHGVKPSNYGARYYFLGPMHIAKRPVMVGGSLSYPCSFEDCAKYSFAGGLNTVGNQKGQTKGQFFSLQSIQIGDGVSETHWKSSYQSLEQAQKYDYGKGIVQVQADEGSSDILIHASDSCVIDFSVTTLNGGNFALFVVDALSSTLATYDFQTFVALAYNPTLQALGLGTYEGASFIGCRELTLNGFNDSATKTLGAITISNCVDAYAVTVTNEHEYAALANSSLRKNNTSILITGDQSGSWADANLTVSGSTYDIEYSGDTNFSIQSNKTLTVNNTGAGVLTIVSGGSSVTFTGIPSGAEYRLYEDDPAQGVIGSNELAGAESHSGGNVVYPFSSGAGSAAILQVMAAGYKERILSFNLPATPQTIPIELELETNL